MKKQPKDGEFWIVTDCQNGKDTIALRRDASGKQGWWMHGDEAMKTNNRFFPKQKVEGV